ncbi:MAG: hypothetical protein C0487_18305 [Leptothrix sp. (in: Bacteria)]|nr:hypothetical protein [Leptothrix sp. (in: b-proteobacteria)]
MLIKTNRMMWLTSGLLALSLVGCAAAPRNTGPKKVPASVGVVNHTDRYIYFASVDGAGGGNMSEYGAGNAGMCCALIPEVWYPGMKVTVRWDMPVGIQHVDKEKVVEVERYEETGSIYIHIFQDDEVKVVVSPYASWSPRHPIPAPIKPTGWKRKAGA